MKHSPLLALALVALAPVADAQSLTLIDGGAVTLDGMGTHGTINNNTTSYDDSDGNFYAVGTNGTATFILGKGGSISAAKQYAIGLDADGSGPITIMGGSISVGQNGFGLIDTGSSLITVTGGSITTGAGGTGLYSGDGPVTITGGTISVGSTGVALSSTLSGTIDLYGTFDGLTLGQTKTLSLGNSSFTGTLTNNTTSQVFTYANHGAITLHNAGIAAAPEPSQFVAFAIGLLGLGALAIKAKRRTA